MFLKHPNHASYIQEQLKGSQLALQFLRYIQHHNLSAEKAIAAISIERCAALSRKL